MKNNQKRRRFIPKSTDNKAGHQDTAMSHREILWKYACMQHAVTENGKSTKKLAFELLALGLLKAGIEGKPTATRYLTKLEQKYGDGSEETPHGYLLVPEPESLEEHKKTLAKHRIKSEKDLIIFKELIESLKTDPDAIKNYINNT